MQFATALVVESGRSVLAALGLAILIIMIVVGAWLFYASIDFDEASAGTPPAGESAPAER